VFKTVKNKGGFMSRIKEEIEEHPLYYLVGKDGKSEAVKGENLEALKEKFFSTPVSAKKLSTREIRPHEVILAPWFREGSLGYIFGLRGSGKTWFAWKMAISISKGEDFGPWKCEKSWKTLYVDGEMPLKSMQDRLKLLEPNPAEELYLMSHDDLAEEEIIFNLCKECQQEWLLEYCVENRVKVVFFDNLSCLCFGMKENEADSWEQVLGWLLRFRRAGIAVVIIHHANRDGNEMRGTSRRS
jgi:RecA-family ATPase